MDTIVATSLATEAPVARRPRGLRRRISIAVAALAIAVTAAGAMPPERVFAAGGTATSGGFVCKTTRTVVNTFPKMTSSTGGTEKVYFKSDLWKWNGSAWAPYRTNGSYTGLSNAYGNLDQAYPSGVYWTMNGRGAGIGAVFANLPAGFYLTAEYYQWASGATASQWGRVAGTGAAWCEIK